MAKTFVGKVGVGKPTVLDMEFSTEKPERRKALDVAKKPAVADVKPVGDASPFDVDDDVKSALMILRSRAEGAAAIVKRTGFSKSFVDDVLAGKFGTNEAAIRKAFKADGKTTDAPLEAKKSFTTREIAEHLGVTTEFLFNLRQSKPAKFDRLIKEAIRELKAKSSNAKDEVMPVGGR